MTVSSLYVFAAWLAVYVFIYGVIAAYIVQYYVMALLARGVYPQDAVLQGWTSTAEVIAWSGLAGDAWADIATRLGAAGITDPTLFAAVPPHMLSEAIRGWRTATTPAPMGVASLHVIVVLIGALILFSTRGK